MMQGVPWQHYLRMLAVMALLLGGPLAPPCSQRAESRVDLPLHSAGAFVRVHERGIALLERARAAGLGSLVVLVGRHPTQLVAELPVVSKEALLSSPVPMYPLLFVPKPTASSRALPP